MSHQTDRKTWLDAIDLNLMSVVQTWAPVTEHMLARGQGGRLIVTSSIAALMGTGGAAGYSTTKAAGRGRVQALALELGQAGIRVNAISAGAMRTLSLAGIRGGKSLMGTGKDWSLLKEDTRMEGVAGCALYLLSSLGHSIAGEVLHVGAGFHAVGVPDLPEEG